MKRIGIIGAGRFGMSLAETLANSSVEVLLLDKARPAIQAASEFATALQGDATQGHVLEQAGFAECDLAVIAIGSNIEVSMMATANCKELGIPHVVAKASSELHGKILRRIGADSVVYPDRDCAHRLARSFTSADAMEFLEVSEGISVAEVDVPRRCRGKTLEEAQMRKEYGVTVLCIRRADAGNPSLPRKGFIPSSSDVLKEDDKLIIFGETEKIDALS